MNKITQKISKKSLFALGLLVILLPACHHKKEIAKTVITPVKQDSVVVKTPVAVPIATSTIDANVRKVAEKLKENELPFTELSAKLKTKVSSPTLNQSFTTTIRWKKGDRIWMSMSIFGIEGARVLITKDSIKLMDKINNRYILKPISFIKQKTFVDLTFTDIENLLLGQLLFTDLSKTKYANNPTNITLNADGIRFITNSVFDKTNNNLLSIFASDKIYAQTIESLYDNYQLQMGKQFSMDRDLKIKSGRDNFQMTAKFQNIEIKQHLEYPFSINPNYTIEK